MSGKVSVKALIVNSDDKFLVLTNSHMGVPHLAYRPDLPGGTMEPGETKLGALVREVQEEIGIDISNAPRKLLGAGRGKDGQLRVELYAVWANIRDFELDEEHCALHWLSLKDLKRQPWWPGYRELFLQVDSLLIGNDTREFPEYRKAAPSVSV